MFKKQFAVQKLGVVITRIGFEFMLSVRIFRESASVNFLYPGRKNDDSVLEISLLRTKHSEKGTTSLVRIASIIKAEAGKRYLCCPTY